MPRLRCSVPDDAAHVLVSISNGLVDALSRTKYIYSMHSPLPKTDATLLGRTVRALPYLLSWAVLAVLMIVGMDRMPLVLYTPIDGEWAKWNVEAILHFGKVFDLSPYSMLAGMGSMYFPNLPWQARWRSRYRLATRPKTSSPMRSTRPSWRAAFSFWRA